MDRERIRKIEERSRREQWPFVRTFDALNEAGVVSYRFTVITGDTEYVGTDGGFISEGPAWLDPVEIAPAFSQNALVKAIERHRIRQTDFREFRREAAGAGVRNWMADMANRTCSYFGSQGGKYFEQVPTSGIMRSL